MAAKAEKAPPATSQLTQRGVARGLGKGGGVGVMRGEGSREQKRWAENRNKCCADLRSSFCFPGLRRPRLFAAMSLA